MPNNPTNIIYLIGKAGTGKYTIALRIAKFGYVICDNQLINNPIFTLLNYKLNEFKVIPRSAWQAISKIRNAVFDFISIEARNNYILTNELYDVRGDQLIYLRVEQIALERGSLFVPVKLLISGEENLRRITQVSRKLRYKSVNPSSVYSSVPLLQISHPNLLEIDVTLLSPHDAAEKILEHVEKLRN